MPRRETNLKAGADPGSPRQPTLLRSTVWWLPGVTPQDRRSPHWATSLGRGQPGISVSETAQEGCWKHPETGSRCLFCRKGTKKQATYPRSCGLKGNLPQKEAERQKGGQGGREGRKERGNLNGTESTHSPFHPISKHSIFKTQVVLSLSLWELVSVTCR